jgi:hypothetical protein
MADRDASRIKLKYPNLDYDGDGAVDSASAFYPCIFGGPNWSGFTKTAVNTTCSNTTRDDWDNIIKTYRSGRVIDMGTLTFDIDWDPNLVSTEESLILAAFYDGRTGNYQVEIPKEGSEDEGPIITIPGVQTNFTPGGTVLAEGDEARLSASVTIQIAGPIVITAAY